MSQDTALILLLAGAAVVLLGVSLIIISIIRDNRAERRWRQELEEWLSQFDRGC